MLERGRYRPVAIPPRLAATAPQGISPMGINDHGQIVGEYEDQDGIDHGFLLDRGDHFTRIDVPGAKGTEAIKLNNRGQIVGAYSDTSTVLEPPEVPKRSFLLERGRLTRLDPPGAVSSQALGINDRGQVVGETSTPPAASTAMCGSGGGSRRATCPAPSEPPPARSATTARSSG